MVGVRGCWSQTILQSTYDVGNRPGLVSVTDGQFKYFLYDRLMALFEKQNHMRPGPWRKLDVVRKTGSVWHGRACGGGHRPPDDTGAFPEPSYPTCSY
jgi:hypothetical protein